MVVWPTCGWVVYGRPVNGRVNALDVSAFISELVLLAGVAVATTDLLPGGPGLGLAVLVAVLVAVGWGRWLAPRAPRRLGRAGRLLLKTVLAVVVSALLIAVARPGWAAVLCVVAVVLAAAELQHRDMPEALS